MLLAITAFACGFIAIPLVNNVMLVVLFFALINCAYSVLLLLKAWFADNLRPPAKTKIFNQLHHAQHWLDQPTAARHAVMMQSINLAFWLAAIGSARFPCFSFNKFG